MIGIVDFSAGNLASIQNCLQRLGAKFFISSSTEKLKTAKKIIFPGVGNAKSTMEFLEKKDLKKFLQNIKVPVLGICLGMQLFFDFSEESNNKCLEIFSGKVRKFSFSNKKIKIPHMGWNSVNFSEGCPIFKNIPQNFDFYFIHSFFCDPQNTNEIFGTTKYGEKEFTSVVWKKNFFGVQFHPEKSGKIGEKIFQNFLDI